MGRKVEGCKEVQPSITQLEELRYALVPKKFIVLEFAKYTLLECPNTHLKSYCNKMAEVIHDDKLLIHFFYDNLTGFALSWFMTFGNPSYHRPVKFRSTSRCQTIRNNENSDGSPNYARLNASHHRPDYRRIP
jgi:hypothetical protein